MPSHPDLFGIDPALLLPGPDVPAGPRRRGTSRVEPAEVPDALKRLAADLPPLLRFGTSSWYFPGWAGLVFARAYPQPSLSRHGLEAYAEHPLLRTVSLDRSFYRPLPAADYARLASQVPDDFRFVVKAASAVTDSSVREVGSGVPAQPNPLFLDPTMAQDEVVIRGALKKRRFLYVKPRASKDHGFVAHPRITRLASGCYVLSANASLICRARLTSSPCK